MTLQSLRQKLSDRDWLIMCSRLGGMRRAKKLREWEFDQCCSGALLWVVAQVQDTIVIESEAGGKYSLRARTIPDDEFATNLSVLRLPEKKRAALFDTKIASIRNLSEESRKSHEQNKRRVNHEQIDFAF